jgi:hypothetical protein
MICPTRAVAASTLTRISSGVGAVGDPSQATATSVRKSAPIAATREVLVLDRGVTNATLSVRADEPATIKKFSLVVERR